MSTLVTGLLVAPLAVLTPHPAMADTTPAVNWAQTAAQGPSGRESSYMDYDSTRHRTVLFGGAFQGTTSNTFFSDTRSEERRVGKECRDCWRRQRLAEKNVGVEWSTAAGIV